MNVKKKKITNIISPSYVGQLHILGKNPGTEGAQHIQVPLYFEHLMK